MVHDISRHSFQNLKSHKEENLANNFPTIANCKNMFKRITFVAPMYKNIPIPEFSSIAFTILKHTAIIITGFPKISWIELEPLGPSLQFLMPSSRSESRGVPSPRDFWRIVRMVSGKTEAIVVERRPITRNWYWKIVAQIPRRH